MTRHPLALAPRYFAMRHLETMKILITGRQLITIVILLGAFFLRALGQDSLISYIILAIAAANLGLSFPARPPPP